MSLKDTINSTNTEKEKVKKVATQIDNKLVELGGQHATDLADVPNKIGAMVTKNYKRITRFNLNKDITYTNSDLKSFVIPLNLEYVPTEIIIRFGCNSNPNIITSSKYSYNSNTMSPGKPNNGSYGSAYITNINNESCRITFKFKSGTIGGTDPHYLYDLIAIE